MHDTAHTCVSRQSAERANQGSTSYLQSRLLIPSPIVSPCPCPFLLHLVGRWGCLMFFRRVCLAKRLPTSDTCCGLRLRSVFVIPNPRHFSILSHVLTAIFIFSFVIHLFFSKYIVSVLFPHPDKLCFGRLGAVCVLR